MQITTEYKFNGFEHFSQDYINELIKYGAANPATLRIDLSEVRDMDKPFESGIIYLILKAMSNNIDVETIWPKGE